MRHYNNPLINRYASTAMSAIFSDENKYKTFRQLWYYLAESQAEIGLAISEEQLSALREALDQSIDFTQVAAYEKKFKHDVMTHIHALADVAPAARGIIHLGATSAFVTDNTDLIQARQALELVELRLLRLLRSLHGFADQHAHQATLGFTHFQSAQPTTVGKRACLWLQSLLFDYEELSFVLHNLPARGVKGTTGTAESFKNLLNGDYQKLKLLDQKVCQKMGFNHPIAVSGQTYDRKLDAKIAQLLGNIAQSMHKISTDLRLLQHLKELEEGFAKEQIGSSAMAYKRNPIKSERIGALAKFVLSLSQSAGLVAATQWLERSLDDSANKRLVLPQCFLAVDAMLLLLTHVIEHAQLYPAIIRRNMMRDLPFMVSEKIIMEGVKKGGDRQRLHEKIRQVAMQSIEQMNAGGENDFVQRIAEDPFFQLSEQELQSILGPENFVGFAVEQTKDFLETKIMPVLQGKEINDEPIEIEI